MHRVWKKLIYHEVSGLHEAAFLLAGFALFSKVLALVRDRLLAHSFGAGAELDIYYAAFRIPDFIYVSLASLVASAVLIPFIIERLNKEDEARSFFYAIFTVFFVAILVVSGIVFLVMPFLSRIVVPGLPDVAQGELVLLSRIMLLSPILLGLSGLFASVTQSLKRFLVYALAPILYNIGIIIGIVAFYPLFGLSGLAYGVVLGALFHMLIQVPVLIRHGFFPRFVFRTQWEEIKSVVVLSFPRTLTLSAHHITILVLIAFASFMAEGSISIFNFAFNLQSVPLSIIGVSYSIAAFPTLSRLYSNGERSAFLSQVLTSMRHIIFWSLPLLVLFIVLRAQIVRTILGTGEFDWSDTRLTAAALALFIISVVAQSLVLLLVRGYYAAGYTRKPLIINLASLVVVLVSAVALNYIFNTVHQFQYFLEALFRIEGLDGSKIIILPMAFSIGAILNIWLLWAYFKKDFCASGKEVFQTLKYSTYGAITMGFVAHQSLRVFDDIFDINTFWGIFSQGFFSGIVGIIAGVLLLTMLKNKELAVVKETLTHKFWRRKPIAPDQGEL
jgi:putative peptidoglycan lipid II flippase